MSKLPKKYNSFEVEKKWQEYWQKEKIFQFNWKDAEKNKNDIFSIDTPPPTISGILHMGHIYSYTLTDFIARFQRMMGKNVFYPIGFDNNGLPTERYIEKLKNINAKNTPRNEFLAICQNNIDEAIKKFKDLFISMGHSYDWDLEYQTISDTSRAISQMSFIDLYNKGVLTRVDEPCIWDITAQSAIAQTEIEDKELESQMNFLKFTTENNETIEIMTTRPELLPACVAIMMHPDLSNKYKSQNAITPLGVKVPIIFDDKVDKDKGTGIVMCCTFGDQTDIFWWKKYNLELKIILNEKGEITLDKIKNIIDKNYWVLEGLKIIAAREKILELLKLNNKIIKEPIKIIHSVKIGERTKTPIEFLVKKQWNVKILDIKEQLHKKASECKWHPEWMESRIHDWIDGLNWDWTISRQRFLGVPIPVWYSKRKGEEGKIILPSVDELPIDPSISTPKGYSKDEVVADSDVFDTWATSSLSPQLSSMGISETFCLDKKKYEILQLPFTLRTQAHEIIRTWAFLTIVKAHYHQNTIPWKNIAIAGWCLAEDKTKMSKSIGNVIDPIKLLKTKSSDSLRYWAANSTLGLDFAYSENNIVIGQKLITKLFNSSKFIEMCYEKLNNKNFSNIKEDIKNNLIFEKIDIYVISQFKQVIDKTEQYFNNYEINKALETIENFFWNIFCDNYLEIVKIRAYGLEYYEYVNIDITNFSNEQKNTILKKQESAIRTMYYIFNYILKIFSIFLPSVCEEIYSNIYEEEFKKNKSVSFKGNWPDKSLLIEDKDIDNLGEEFIKIVSNIRKYKSEQNISIKEVIQNIYIYTHLSKELELVIEDLKNVCNLNNIQLINSNNFNIKYEKI